MAKYSFKSVGVVIDDSKTLLISQQVTQPPIGIKTPLSFGNPSEGFLSLNYTYADEFADNLRNLIMTNWGERVGLYDFGANLRPLCTELISQDDFDTQAINNIKTAVNKWMPQIELEDFTSTSDYKDNKNTAVRKITVTYRIPVLDTTKRAIQVVLNAF